MRDYLSVTITDGDKSWAQQGMAVPRVGDYVTCRNNSSEVFSGKVYQVHWGVREGRPGMEVTVWFEEEAEDGSEEEGA